MLFIFFDYIYEGKIQYYKGYQKNKCEFKKGKGFENIRIDLRDFFKKGKKDEVRKLQRKIEGCKCFYILSLGRRDIIYL